MKENFDDIIRRRWEAQQFPVDEQHRQDMARLLEGEKKRRGFVFWWFGGAAVTLLSAIALFIYNAPQAEEKAMLRHFDTLSAPPTQTQPRATAQQPAEAMLRAAQTHPGATAQQTAEEKVELKAGSSNTSHDVKSKSSQGSKKVVPINSTKNKSLDGQTDTKVKPRTSQRSESTENILTNNEVGGTQQEAGSEVPAGGYKVELENPNQVAILSEVAAIRVFPDSLEYDPWTNAIYRDGTVRSLNMTKELDPLAIQEVKTMDSNAPGMIKPQTKISHPLYLMAETGLGLVLASKPFYDGGIKFNIGGGLGYKLMPQVHLQLTGGYLMQDGGFDFERTSTVNTLDFGVRSQFNSLQPDRLHFVYGKFGVAYRFHKSSLYTHMGVQWLYGAQGDITIQQQSQVPPGNHETSNYTWLSTDGLRKTQWWSDVAYGYMIVPRLNIQGGVTFYWTSLTESNAALQAEGYYWNGKTASVQPFITLNYLLHANF